MSEPKWTMEQRETFGFFLMGLRGLRKKAQTSNIQCRETSLAVTNMQQAEHWLAEAMKDDASDG